MSTTKATPSLKTLEALLDEAVEACQEIIDLRVKLGRSKPGSAAYWNQLAQISVSAGVIAAKLEVTVREIDAIEDRLPDEED